MNTQATRITKGSIKLPKDLRDQWENTEVVLYGKEDEIVIRKWKGQAFSQMLDALNKIGKTIKKKDVEEAIRWARKQPVS